MEQKFDEKLEVFGTNVEQKFDQKLDVFETSTKKRTDYKLNGINEQLQHLDNKTDMILDEVVRVHESLQGQIDNIEKDMNELKQYYRVDRLENYNMSLLLRLTDDLTKRVENLENKIA